MIEVNCINNNVILEKERPKEYKYGYEYGYTLGYGYGTR